MSVDTRLGRALDALASGTSRLRIKREDAVRDAHNGIDQSARANFARALERRARRMG